MFNDFQGEFEWIFNIILRVKVNVEVNSAMGKDREVDNFLVYTNLEEIKVILVTQDYNIDILAQDQSPSIQ